MEATIRIRITGSFPKKISDAIKNEARKATESMSKKKLLGYYKHRFDFVKIGEVVEAVEIIND